LCLWQLSRYQTCGWHNIKADKSFATFFLLLVVFQISNYYLDTVLSYSFSVSEIYFVCLLSQRLNFVVPYVLSIPVQARTLALRSKQFRKRLVAEVHVAVSDRPSVTTM